MLMNNQSRIELIQKALSAEEKKPTPERREVPWRQSSERLVVVEIPLNLVLLNPNSHRIQAQLQSHERYEQVKNDPFSEESQNIIAGFLREPSDSFEELKSDLKASGQREPGVITRKGVLVNANRRTVALRDLGMDYIRVMVLPEDAGPEDINELELRLQIKKELREDYTFTNTLLFIKDCLNSNWSHQRVARELGYGDDDKGVAKVKQAERILALIDEIREESGRKYSYRHFDAAQQALEELDRKYEDLKQSDPDAARKMRDARLAGILSGVGYRELRSVGPEFGQEYLDEAIRDHDDLKPLADQILGDAEASSSPAGVDELFGASPSEDDPASRLYRWLIEHAGSRHVRIDKSGVLEERARVVEYIGAAFTDAAKAAKADSQRESAIEAPRNRVKEARKKVQVAKSALHKALPDPQLKLSDLTSLETDTNSLMRELKGFKVEIDKAIAERRKDSTRTRP